MTKLFYPDNGAEIPPPPQPDGEGEHEGDRDYR